jgi:hypothetical protein
LRMVLKTILKVVPPVIMLLMLVTVKVLPISEHPTSVVVPPYIIEQVVPLCAWTAAGKATVMRAFA